MCGVEGCERPAGFATDHSGYGPCRRHGGHATPGFASSRARPATATLGAAETDEELAPALRGEGRPSPDPTALMGVLLSSARRAGFPFADAWKLATSAALSYMSERRAEQWADVLASTRHAWADAYEGRPSGLASLG
jgi:hypothetical protein